MKLEPKLLDYIKRALHTAQLLKFEDFVIEDGLVRGWNPAKTALIVDHDVPDLPFLGIGFNRVPKLIQRLGMMDDYVLDLEIKNDFVLGLVIKGDGATLKYKCANPNAIKTPKVLHDKPMWTFELSPQDIDKIARGQAAMNAPMIQFKCTDGKLVVRLTDTERDTYEQALEGHVENISNLHDMLDFDKLYDTTILLTAIRAADKPKNVKGQKDSIIMTMGAQGNLQTHINGILVNLAPQIPPKTVL